jgi:mannose-6-phosphate isomerase-like protein (cupin superfamily)
MEFERSDMSTTLWFADTRVRVLVSEETNSVVESEARAGNMPPLHVHHNDDETFYVLDGELSVISAEGEVRLGAGEAAFAPRGVPHCYRVESDMARWIVSTTDGGFASFVEAASTPAENDGYAPLELMPAPEQLGALAAEQGIELLGPPGALPR